MVTAQPVFSALRIRPHRARPGQLLWLAALLLGLLYMHGVSAEGAAGHASPLAASATAAQGNPGAGGRTTSAEHAVEGSAPDGHDGGHEDAHPSQACVSVPPEHGGDVPAPCLAPLDAVAAPQAHPALQRPGPAHAVPASPPLSGTSAVLRI
ncbi:DUF6153 family protein [Streptomyces alkaliterrae]|uniref:Uncharacterized protein n=1 Tax=Streptomyces alkaliterrae TaxID=2213162 RepID=A0A5P0YVY9_9ACTN|nr:DUF6153 family protein [Streptomyces alkaliterrae]MBB1252814.1 hypothetical protein [Streptomyces alkaliterrae]MBB1259058.1 hypothetical protein [Streptomyces alkaliterrae]MQS04458.1 hypothetical protein [Streptomyces alkaliterrae]